MTRESDSVLSRSVAHLHMYIRTHIYIQILRDVPKARREVDLHWRVAAHENIVNLIDIYENVYMGQRSLLVVMEWSVCVFLPSPLCVCVCVCAGSVCVVTNMLLLCKCTTVEECLL